MKNKKSEKKVVPNLTMKSDYFYCPRCGWMYPGPMLVRGDIANVKCEKCGHSYLVRKK